MIFIYLFIYIYIFIYLYIYIFIYLYIYIYSIKYLLNNKFKNMIKIYIIKHCSANWATRCVKRPKIILVQNIFFKKYIFIGEFITINLKIC